MGPVAIAIQAAYSAFVATEVGAFLTTTIVGRLLVMVAGSMIFRALSKKPSAQESGFATKVTQNGGTNPLTFCLGKSDTGGAFLCPPMTQGDDGKAPNAYMTYVVELGCIPGDQLLDVIINGEYVDFSGAVDPNYGMSATGTYAGYAWLKFYDGSQTTADSMLLAKYGTYPERPWQADMIGRGLAIAILTFRVDQTLWLGDPQVRFVMQGIPLYDPRADSTVGGSGTQRWADTSTWQASNNPFVQIYNLARGITLPIGVTYGGGYAAADLPLDNWFAAMNEADVAVDDGAGGTIAQFQTGLEIKVSDPPLDNIQKLLTGSAGKIAEVGGTLKALCGGPALPSLFITDDDILISEADDFTPFPGLRSVFNGANATYPEPASQWQPTQAPTLTNPTYEAQDQGQQLLADLKFDAVSIAGQVQRLMKAYVEEQRRFRRHNITLPPEAMAFEPLDSLSLTSTRFGYTSKVFENTQQNDDPHGCTQTVAIWERDGSDFDPTGFIVQLPTAVSGASVPPAAQSLLGFAVAAAAIEDTGAVGRLSAIQASWTSPGTDDVRAIRVQIRRQSDQVVVSDIEISPDLTSIVFSQGIVAGVTYEARGVVVPITGRKVSWTNWAAIVAPDVTNTPSDGTVTTPKIVDYGVSNRIATTVSNTVTQTSATNGTETILQTETLATAGSLETIVVVQGKLTFKTTSPPSPVGNVVMYWAVYRDSVPLFQGPIISLAESSGTQTVDFNMTFAIQSTAGSTVIYLKPELYADDYASTPFTWDGTIGITELKK